MKTIYHCFHILSQAQTRYQTPYSSLLSHSVFVLALASLVVQGEGFSAACADVVSTDPEEDCSMLPADVSEIHIPLAVDSL